jgi:hypothetical protein
MYLLEVIVLENALCYPCKTPSVPTYLANILQIFLPIRSKRDNAGFRYLIEKQEKILLKEASLKNWAVVLTSASIFPQMLKSHKNLMTQFLQFLYKPHSSVADPDSLDPCVFWASWIRIWIC